MRIKRVTHSWMGLKRMCLYRLPTIIFGSIHDVSLHKTVKACNNIAVIPARSILFKYYGIILLHTRYHYTIIIIIHRGRRTVEKYMLTLNAV